MKYDGEKAVSEVIDAELDFTYIPESNQPTALLLTLAGSEATFMYRGKYVLLADILSPDRIEIFVDGDVEEVEFDWKDYDQFMQQVFMISDQSKNAVNKYQKFVAEQIKTMGYKSMGGIPDDERKDVFKEISKRWSEKKVSAEDINSAGYFLVEGPDGNGEIIIQDKDGGGKEIWVKSPYYAGYTILLNGEEYEFVRSLPDQKESKRRSGKRASEDIDAAGYFLVEGPDGNGEIIIQDKDSGGQELWARNPGFAGYTILLNGEEYEFIRSIPDQKKSSVAHNVKVAFMMVSRDKLTESGEKYKDSDLEYLEQFIKKAVEAGELDVDVKDCRVTEI